MRRRLLLFLALFALLLPMFSLAQRDQLDADIGSFQNVISQDAADEAQQALDDRLEQGNELFPDDGTDTGREADIEETSRYVVFRENGVPYELKDVPRDAWFAPYVRDTANRGIVSGYRDADGRPLGEFHPERDVSVEEMAKIAVEIAISRIISTDRCPEPAKNPTAAGSWSVQFVSCAEQQQWSLFSDGTVDVKRPATRAEVINLILEASRAPMKEWTGSGSLFTDVDASTQFRPAIVTAVLDGIIAGYTDSDGNPTGMFGPNNPINRAELSKMLSIALQLYAGK